MTQHELFDDLDTEVEEERTIQERFEQFDAAHPEVYALFKRFAFELKAVGRERYGAKSIIERIRWHMATTHDASEDFKINNNYTSRYVRKLEAECPEFETFFEKRKLTAE